MALYQHDAVSVNVGERLRELREARNISMRENDCMKLIDASAAQIRFHNAHRLPFTPAIDQQIVRVPWRINEDNS